MQIPLFASSIRSRLARIALSTLAAAVFVGAPAAKAALVASDNAGNYATWTNGSNGGTGFLPWDLTSNNNNGTTVFAGYFVGDSTAGSGNINTGGQSFGMYANPGGAFANASRSFNGVLTLGQTFAIQLAVNFRNGNKGLNLLSGATQVFNFNIGSVGGADGYYYTVGTGAAVSTNFNYFADSVFTLAYTQQSATAGVFNIARTSATGGAAATNSLSVPVTASDLSSLTLYNSNTDGGGAQNNLYFNNLAVVPEPTVCVLAALGGTVLTVLRRRKKS